MVAKDWIGVPVSGTTFVEVESVEARMHDMEPSNGAGLVDPPANSMSK